MTSSRKIVANWRNSRKSSGPRTAAGKSEVSRNALRHGLAALTHRQSLPTVEIERLARAICGDDAMPQLQEQAWIIAENELVLRAIQTQKLALIERLHDKTNIALARGDNSVQVLQARIRQSDMAEQYILNRCAQIREKYKDRLYELRRYDEMCSDSLIPVSIIMLDECIAANEAMRDKERRARYLDQARKLIDERDKSGAVRSLARSGQIGSLSAARLVQAKASNRQLPEDADGIKQWRRRNERGSSAKNDI